MTFETWVKDRRVIKLHKRIAKYERYIAKVKIWLKEDKKRLRRELNGNLTKY
tara:strand:+ start:302 stop:457 length:156 start_codon:yes stop_codon:yes gene_type:complete